MLQTSVGHVTCVYTYQTRSPKCFLALLNPHPVNQNMSSAEATVTTITGEDALTRPSSLACLECRRKHLKCDAATPACARCISRGLSCNYTPSRRGYRRWAKRSAPDGESQSTGRRTSPYCPSEPSHWISAGATIITGSSLITSDEVNTGNLVDDPVDVSDRTAGAVTTQEPLPVLIQGPASHPSQRTSTWIDDEQLVNLYYLNFHTAHPILLPRNLYWKRAYPRFLKAVVEFVGSHFSPATSSNALREATARELGRGDQNTPEMVQARIIYAISLLARNEAQEGQRELGQAIKTAIELGMHRRDFAAAHATIRPIEEESLRRTWYELYVTDGCIAAFQRKSSFETNAVGADVLLPCEEGMYADGMCLLNPPSKDDFDSRVFADEEVAFSSFSYRIEAVRILGRVLSITGAHGVHRDEVQAVDNALAAWMHHLPPSKSDSEIVNTYGELDEVMFQAHTLIQYATILLHFPRGDLTSPVPATTDVPGGQSAKFLCPCTRQHVHSIKAIDASKTLSMLAALRIPVQKHSPFFVYPLALGAIVQLSVSMSHSSRSNHCLEQHRDRTTLILGVLKSLSRYWSIAEIVLRALKKVAFAIFQPSRNEANGRVQPDCSIDNSIDPATGVGNSWLESLDVQDLQELMGLDTNAFCL